MTDDAYVEDDAGHRTGPFKTKFVGEEFTFFDQSFDAVEGNFIIQILPNGREKKYRIQDVQFRGALRQIPAHYNVKTASNLLSISNPMTTTNYNINGTNVQVGNHNTQQITTTLNSLIEQINNGSGSDAQKHEAKSKLRLFLENPVVAAVLGSAVQAAIVTLGS